MRTGIDRRAFPRNSVSRRQADRAHADDIVRALFIALRAIDERERERAAAIDAGILQDDGTSYRFQRRRRTILAHLYRATLCAHPELRALPS